MFELLGISLSFAAFLLLHAFLSFVAGLLWKRFHKHHFQSAAVRADVIFFFRIAPLGISILSVGLFLFPAFLLNEPRQNAEIIGWPLGFLAFVSIGGVFFALGRLLIAIWNTQRLEQRWKVNAELIKIDGLDMPVFCLSNDFPVVAVVGIFRPRLFISEHVFSTLNQHEFAATIAHERGHLFAHDNFKRILLRLSHDMLLSVSFGKSLERAWQHASESAADEFAVRKGKIGALDLASALIKIARTIPAGLTVQFPISAGIIGGDSAGITSRVTSLLEIADADSWEYSPRLFSRRTNLLILLVSVLASIFCFFNLFTILSRIHEITEIVVAGLQ